MFKNEVDDYCSVPNPDVLGISNKLKPVFQPLVYWPDKKLSQQCENVSEFNETLEQFVFDLAYSMVERSGIGIAAPQVGKLLNVIIVEQQLDYSHPIVLINPKIVDTDESFMYTMREGCLSVPGYYEDRKRPQKVVVEYYTPHDIQIEKEFQGLGAFVLQHEMDHLQGKVFVDNLSKFKQQRVLNKVKKTRRIGR